ncbi:MAG: Hint domain-containing protein [Pseudomonadota bacterium]
MDQQFQLDLLWDWETGQIPAFGAPPTAQTGCLAPRFTAVGAEFFVVTTTGLRRAADLDEGTLVLTRDLGFSPVVRVQRVKHALADQAGTRVVRVPCTRVGGEDGPKAVFLHPRHGVLWRVPSARDRLGAREVLIPAARLVELAQAEWVTLANHRDDVCIILAEHALIPVGGLWIETTPDIFAIRYRHHVAVRERISRKDARRLL